MWRQPHRLLLSPPRLLVPKPSSGPKSLIKRFYSSQDVSPLNLKQYASSKRFVTISIAFLAGFSIYFFLEDPVLHVSRNPLSPTQFVPSLVLSSEDSGYNTKLIKLAVPRHTIPPINPGPIWSVFIKDDDIQVERAYTPLSGIDKNGHMSFWIKRYPNGEVGRWLHSKQAGDKVELRGPLTTWPWNEDAWDEIVMISGGTGITPFMQLFNTVISKPNEASKTRFTLLHSSRITEELPPPELLDPLIEYSSKNPEKFEFHIFIDKEPAYPLRASVPQLNIGRITEGILQEVIRSKFNQIPWWSRLWSRSRPESKQRRILFLVCGPEPMIAAIAGPYGRNFSQGPIGGALGRLGYTSDQVFKL